MATVLPLASIASPPSIPKSTAIPKGFSIIIFPLNSLPAARFAIRIRFVPLFEIVTSSLKMSGLVSPCAMRIIAVLEFTSVVTELNTLSPSELSSPTPFFSRYVTPLYVVPLV